MKHLKNWRKPSFERNPFLFLQHEIDNAINNFYHLFETPSSRFSKDFEKQTLIPSVDIVEDEKNFKVEVEMPGMGEEDIQVAVKDQALVIKGEKEISKKNEKKDYISREIDYGSYEKIISLPDYVDINHPKASFKKGMLWVVFPKKSGTESQRREIKVERAEG